MRYSEGTVFLLSSLLTLFTATSATEESTVKCICVSSKELHSDLNCHRSTGQGLANPLPFMSSSEGSSQYQTSYSCEAGIPKWDPFYGHRSVPGVGNYTFHAVLKTWSEAAVVCRSRGGHLAVIDTKDEYDVVTDIFSKYPHLSHEHMDNLQIWIGATDLVEEGKFVTVLGKPMETASYLKWLPGQPDNSGDEDCVTLRRDGTLNDDRCGGKRAFICENEQYRKEPEVGYLKLHPVLKTWDEARSICRSHGSHLAVIDTKGEYDVMMDLFSKYPLLSNNVWENIQIWLGATDLAEEGKFVTVLGNPMETAPYLKWLSGQPDNSGDEDCITLRRDGTLNDDRCKERRSFICENAEYRRVPGVGYFKVYPVLKTWEEASRLCQSEDAHLVVIDTEEEYDVIMDLLSKYPLLSNNVWENIQIWLGATDRAEEGKFVTVLGNPMETTSWLQWLSGQPDNYMNEDCVTLRRDGTLNDDRCEDRRSFICEKEEYKTVQEGVGNFKFHAVLKTWSEAESTCRSHGAHLAVIDTKDEYDLTMDLFSRYPHLSHVHMDNLQMWIGATDRGEEGKFVTVLENPLETTPWLKWLPGQPDNSGNEDCVTLRRDGTLNDDVCEARRSFICENRKNQLVAGVGHF